MGAWVAAEAARRADPLRAPVVLLEAGGLEAVAPAMATVTPGREEDGPLRPALIDGARVLEQFEVNVGRGIGFGRPGWVQLDGSAPGHDMKAPAFALGLEESDLATASWNREAGLFDPARLHTEVLSLGRTRGLVTRPGTHVEQIRSEGGQTIGLETDRGRFDAEIVLITDPEVAHRLLPELASRLRTKDRFELRFKSNLFETSMSPVGTIRGSAQELYDMGTDPESLDAFFGGGESLEYPHPAVSTDHLDIFPDALSSELVVGSWEPSNITKLRTELAAIALVFRDLGAEGKSRRISITSESSGVPLVGEVAPGLFVALGLGLRAAQLAAGLAPGVVALMHKEPVAAFDPGLLAPGATRRGQS